jgi:DNA-directed RNA polymerase specialized sigma24 family protein
LTSRTGVAFAKLTQSLDAEEDEGETVEVTWETPESLAITSATREALQYAFERLPPGYREVVPAVAPDMRGYGQTAAPPPSRITRNFSLLGMWLG